MHPWISGQLVDQYQRNARAAALARTRGARPGSGAGDSPHGMRHAVGVTLLRWGGRLAPDARMRPAPAGPRPSRRIGGEAPWTTCGATSTSGR